MQIIKVIVIHVGYLVLFPMYLLSKYGESSLPKCIMMGLAIMLSAIGLVLLNKKQKQISKSWLSAFISSSIGIVIMAIVVAVSYRTLASIL